MHRSARGLFGRDRELAEADEALDVAASGTPQVLLVGGDAGIGKTTLTTAVAERSAARGFTVLIGHCLDLDTGAGLQPVREALRDVVRRPDDELPPVTRRLAPYLRGDDEGASVDDLGLVVSELAEREPVLLVFEDMHWADQSTEDLVVSLAHTAHGPLALVLTYRTDDLTRRHPFRQTLVELGRSPGARRIDLGPLDRDAIADIAQASTGHHDAALAGALHARSEGNPLYAEEMLDAGLDNLPGPLNDLLLARVDALSTHTRDLLRLASVHGSRLDPELLAAVTGLRDDEVDARLREAIDANVLRSMRDRVEFRHGLLREAVYDDLLPGERSRTHGLMAQAMEGLLGERPGLVELGALAHHWYAAHDVARAYAAAVRAGEAADRYGSQEAIAFLDRALELYEQVPPDRLGSTPKVELVRMLAWAYVGAGYWDQGLGTMREALQLVEGESDPLRVSRVYASYASLMGEIDGCLTHQEALARAVAVLGEQPSAELAGVLWVRAFVHTRTAHYAVAIRDATRALEMVADLAEDRPDVTLYAWQARGWAEIGSGRYRDGVGSLENARRAAVTAGNVSELLMCDYGVAYVLACGLDPARGLAMAEDLRARAHEQGLPALDSKMTEVLAHGLLAAGRLAECERVLAQVAGQSTGPRSSFWLWPLSRLRLAQGDTVGALDLERQRMQIVDTMASLPESPEVVHHVLVLVANGLVPEAEEFAGTYAERYSHGDGCLDNAAMARALYEVVLGARRTRAPRNADLVRLADTLLDRAVEAAPPGAEGHVEGLNLLIAPALRAEVHEQASTDAWRAAVVVAGRIGPGVALPVRICLVAALLTEGARDEARVLLPEVWADAREMGAAGIEAEALRLGRRHRIPVGDGRQAPNPLDVLTAREREVLDVLVTGATNKAIAERLFISEKTVSVHVTNLMDKLGAANRGEAAAIARELVPAE